MQLTTTTHRPRKDERLSWPGWLTYRPLPTQVVTRELQVERRTGKVRRSKTNVLPLCHASDATNQDSRVSRSSIPNAAAAVLLPRTVTSRDLSSPRDVVGLPTLATVCRYRPTACQQTLNFVTIVRSTLLFTTDATALAASHSRLPAEVTSRRHG